MYHNNIVVILVDDKCIIPVGKPDGGEPDGDELDGAVSTGVQGHNRFLVTIDGPVASLRPRLPCAWQYTICSFFH